MYALQGHCLYHCLIIIFWQDLQVLSMPWQPHMILVRTPLGTVSNGARRWLKIGPIQFQPAEIAKIAVIVCLSYMIVHMGKKMNSLKACMTLGGMGTFLAMLAYVCTDNLSTAIIIFCITAGMIFCGNQRPGFSLSLLVQQFSLMAIIVLIIGQTVQKTDDFRLNRIVAWLHPENATGDAAYQTIQALYAIGSGGFLGRTWKQHSESLEVYRKHRMI